MNTVNKFDLTSYRKNRMEQQWTKKISNFLLRGLNNEIFAVSKLETLETELVQKKYEYKL